MLINLLLYFFILSKFNFYSKDMLAEIGCRKTIFPRIVFNTFSLKYFNFLTLVEINKFKINR